MAVISPSVLMQNGSHSARSFRQALSALLGQDIETFVNSVDAVGPAHGLVRSGDLAVTQKAGAPDISVDVGAGLCWITGESSLAQGPYPFANDAPENLPLATPDGTHPRIDLVVAQIRDHFEDAGGFSDSRAFVVTGTAAALPDDPALPPSCLVLARVNVPSGAVAIIDADITLLAAVVERPFVSEAVARTAWGVVGYAESTTPLDDVAQGSIVDRTGLSVTFTAVAGRRYRTSAFVAFASGAAAAVRSNVVITDGANVQLQTDRQDGDTSAHHPALIESGLLGPTTRKIRVNPPESTGYYYAIPARPSFILVEDIGPV